MNTENNVFTMDYCAPCPRSKVLAILRGGDLIRAKIKRGKLEHVHGAPRKNSNAMQCKTGVGGVDFLLYHLIYYEFL